MDKVTMPKAPLEPEKADSGAWSPPKSPYAARSLPSTRDVDLTQRIVSRLQQAPDTESALRIALEELGVLLGAQVAVGRLGTQAQLLNPDMESEES